MDSIYEKRLMGSSYSSPAKSELTSPLKSPSREIYSDRCIPVRGNSKWLQMDLSKNSNNSPDNSLTKNLHLLPINSDSSGSICPSFSSTTWFGSLGFNKNSSNKDKTPPVATSYSYSYYNQQCDRQIDFPRQNYSLGKKLSDPISLNQSTQSNAATIEESIANRYHSTTELGQISVDNNQASPQISTINNSSNGHYNNNGDIYESLVNNELFTGEITDYVDVSHSRIKSSSSSVLANRENPNIFTFKIKKEDPDRLTNSPYSLSPISDRSHRLLKQPRKTFRKIPKTAYKVLDAPELQDDFYLNLVDWSSSNTLAVGLGSCVYLWSASNSQVTRLCDLSNESDTVTSVSWAEKGGLVAVGTYRGIVQIWDANENKMHQTFQSHNARVGALAWNCDTVVSGSRDRSIRLRDVRIGSPSVAGTSNEQQSNGNPSRRNSILQEHRQEVCGLRWSPDRQLLASGGNDNRLLVWSLSAGLSRPLLAYEQHLAAVKALDWSPHQHGLLASGGGTADKCIRFWNTMTGQPLQCIDTGSQVCNVAWSKHSNELVSTHGYSQNQILLWRYPSMNQIAKLTGHTMRVLYLAMSPCGENIVTGAGDETLRFWNVFNKTQLIRPIRSSLGLFDNIIR